MNVLPRKQESYGLSVGEDFVILSCVVFTQCQRVTDRQTTRRWLVQGLHTVCGKKSIP